MDTMTARAFDKDETTVVGRRTVIEDDGFIPLTLVPEETTMSDNDVIANADVITVDASNICPPHEYVDSDKVEAMASEMAMQGWQGRPLLVIDSCGAWLAITGSHRIKSAVRAGLDNIPCYVLFIDGWEASGEDVYHNGERLSDDDQIYTHLQQSDDAVATALMAVEIAKSY